MGTSSLLRDLLAGPPSPVSDADPMTPAEPDSASTLPGPYQPTSHKADRTVDISERLTASSPVPASLGRHMGGQV